MYEREFMDLYHDCDDELEAYEAAMDRLAKDRYGGNHRAARDCCELPGLLPIEREVLNCICFDGETLEVTARILDISEGEVLHHLREARQKFFDEDGDESGDG